MNRRQLLLTLTTLTFLAILPTHVFSQITLSDSDFLGQIGSRQVVLEDRRFSIPIDVGSPGANQVWDFRSQAIGDSAFGVTEFLRLDETVSGTTFPGANLVEKITSYEAPGSAFFNFFKVTATDFLAIGDSSYISTGGFDTSFVFFQNDSLAPLPLLFNNTWLAPERDTTGIYPLTANISIDTTLNTVDGWGTVRLPMGDFECLRVHQKVKVTNQSIVNGILVSTNVDSFVQYDWISKDVFLVATAQSQNGDMNPNFTNAQGFGRLDSLSIITSVQERDNLTGIPSNFQLFDNYPNPFNPETVIKYQLNESADVEVAIFNLLGQRIRLLLSQNQPEGIHQIKWDGTNDAGRAVSSGVYLYELRSGALRQSKKMLLLQ